MSTAETTADEKLATKWGTEDETPRLPPSSRMTLTDHATVCRQPWNACGRGQVNYNFVCSATKEQFTSERDILLLLLDRIEEGANALLSILSKYEGT